MVQPHEAQRHDGSPAHEASSHPREQTLFSRYVVKQACGLAGYLAGQDVFSRRLAERGCRDGVNLSAHYAVALVVRNWLRLRGGLGRLVGAALQEGGGGGGGGGGGR